MRPEYSQLAQVLAALALLLGAAKGVGYLFAYFRQPRVIGEILGGLLLGPTFLSSLLPSVTDAVFSKTGFVPRVLFIISQLGLILLMYTSGTELRSFLQRGERRVVAVLTASGTILPFVAGLGFVLTLDSSDLEGSVRNRNAFLLVFACAIAVTSIPVISRIMLDLKILDTAFARIILATALIEDIILYVVLAVALGLVQETQDTISLPSFLGLGLTSPWRAAYYVLITILFFAGILVAGPAVLRWVLRFLFPVMKQATSLIIQVMFLLVVTGLSLLLGVTPLFGALAAGVVAGRLDSRADIQARESIKRFSIYFFVPIYFATVGFRLDLVRGFDLSFFLIFLAFACIAKGLSIYVGARIAGQTHAAAINLSVALNARGGPGIVIASLAFEAGIINEGFFAILVMLAVVTSLVAGSWLGRVVRRGQISLNGSYPHFHA